MKKHLITLVLLLAVNNIFAHYIWIETSASGTLNTEHAIKIRFGEFSEGVFEKVDDEHFKNVSNFKVWLIDPQGNKTFLQVSPKTDYYAASFIPKINGTYTIALDNKNIKVFDFTKYDYTTFKPQYHAKSRVVVGDNINDLKETNSESIEIIDITTVKYAVSKNVQLQVLYKGKPLEKSEVTLFVADGWSQKITTDVNGIFSFKLPWKTTYTVEATHEEKVPGVYQGINYNILWHCATYGIVLN